MSTLYTPPPPPLTLPHVSTMASSSAPLSLATLNPKVRAVRSLKIFCLFGSWRALSFLSSIELHQPSPSPPPPTPQRDAYALTVSRRLTLHACDIGAIRSPRRACHQSNGVTPPIWIQQPAFRYELPNPHSFHMYEKIIQTAREASRPSGACQRVMLLFDRLSMPAAAL